MLLLDEPTNHLDLVRIRHLEEWLNALPRDMPVVISSHDRAFLDAVTNRTLFLRPQQSQVFSLPYSRARAALDEADAADERHFNATQDGPATAPASRQAEQHRHQLRQRPLAVEDPAAEAARREAGGRRKARASWSARRERSSLQIAAPTPRFSSPWTTPRSRRRTAGCCSRPANSSSAGTTGSCCSDRTEQARPVLSGCCGRRSKTPQIAQAGIKATDSLVLGYCDQALADLDDTDTPMRDHHSPLRCGRPAVARIARRRWPVDRDAEPSDRPPFRRTEGASSGCWCCG